MQKKIQKESFDPLKIYLNWFRWIAPVKKIILVISTQCDNRQSYNFADHEVRLFPTQLLSQWSLNMENVLSFRFQQCLGPFTMSLVERSSET